MKKITLLLTAILFACVFANAQTPKISTKWEPTFNERLQKKGVYNDYLGENESAYFLLIEQLKRGIETEFFIEKYDKKNLHPIGTKTVDETLGVLKTVYMFGGETYVCIYENPPKYFKKVQTPIYGLYHFNKENMTFEKVTAKLGVETFGSLDLSISPDGSKVLFVFQDDDKNKKTDDSFRFLVTDNQLNKIFEKTVTLSNVMNAALSNNGTAFAAIRNFTDKKKDLYNYEILKLSAGGENRFTVNMNNLQYQEMQLLTNNENKLLALGFYTDKADDTKTGTYFFSMNDEFNAAENFISQQIPLKILNLNRKHKVKERYSDFEFGTPLYGENGTIVICAEENTSRKRTTVTYREANRSTGQITSSNTPGTGFSLGTSSSSSTNSEFFDIYAFRIDGDKLSWAKRVPKYQRAVDGDKVAGAPMLSDRLSYEAFLSGDNVVVLFSDNIKKNMANNELSEDVSVAFGKDCNLVSVVLEKDGKQNKAIVQTPALTKDELDPEMKKCFRISNSQGILSARKRTDCKMGVITVQ
ncbi:MAG: hypothetical protein LBR75_01810 [Prevotellaceae bacterium]|jgi:hypothetical protein|nr:hypothetical protein [Prevotellaceae bacterium]